MTGSPSATPGRSAPESPLERALDRACGGRAIPGNRLRHLADGPSAFALMVQAIDEARRFVHLENYLIRDDATGRRFAERLGAAARRGVAVRVLYDAFGCRATPRAFWRRLRQAGVEARAFNPVNLFRPVRSLRRDHRKYVGVDGARAVVGGLCIGDEWAGDPGRRRLPWRDTAVDVCGAAAAAIDVTFHRLWRLAGGEIPNRDAQGETEPCGSASVRAVEGLPGRLRIYRAFELLVAGAAHRVWITEAYLVAPTPLVAGLIAAARDGVDVRLLLPGKSDIPALRAFTRVGYRELLQAGARIWEWRGPMLHAKTVLADQGWLKVGSSNLNPSSLLANYELDVLANDPDLAEEAAHQFRRDLTHATEVMLRRPRVPARLAGRWPPAVVSAGVPHTVADHTPGARERSRRAVIALRVVAAGARRSIAGAFLFGSAGLGVLFALAPQIMGYLVALVCFTVAVNAGRQFLVRRRQRDE
ncbi:MAG: cardiolipin synthase B [Gemmatimonadetes bacterium]|nr:cardiolipin synthase B [Gemmatimonadota bacterium]